jgi:hypothetical protein
MNPLIILAALVAVTAADGSADSFQSCLNEAKSFKTCIFQNVNETTRKNFEQLRGLKDVLQKCFEQEGVKGICTLQSPASPPPRLGQRPSTPAARFGPQTPPAEFASCFSGAKNAFLTCFKKEAGIPEDFKPEGLEGQQRPPPFFGGPQINFPHDPQAIKAAVLEHCNNNQDAANKLETCAMEVVKPFLPALIAVAKPVLVACQAAATCAKTQPISADCKAKLQQGGKAFCTCRQEFPKFFTTSSECSAARATIEKFRDQHAAAAQEAENAVATHHDFPQHPHEQFDFCAENHENVCKELGEKLRAAHANKTPAQ